MLNPKIRKEWKETVDKYKKYFGDNEELPTKDLNIMCNFLNQILITKLIYIINTNEKL